MSAHFGVRILKITLALTMDVANSTKVYELLYDIQTCVVDNGP